MLTKLADIPAATQKTHRSGENVFLDKDTQITHFGAYIGTLGSIEAGVRCDCPNGEKHSDGKGEDYAVTTALGGGEVGIHCSGNECAGIRYLPYRELTQEEKVEWAKQQGTSHNFMEKNRHILPSREEYVNLNLSDTVDKTGPISAKSFDDLLIEMSDPSLLAIPKDLQVIDGTWGRFYHGGMHLVHGISKAGKTYFVLDTLNKAKGARVIWIDGDQNDRKMIEKFENVTHLAPINTDTYLNMWLQSGVDFEKVVFVIDSLKDFRNNNEMDSNSGMDSIIKRLKHFTKLGATVVVIHHSTPLWDGHKIKGVKLKGNAEAIYSNTDITYLFERDFGKSESKLTVERSRVEDMPTGTVQKITPAGVIKHNTSIGEDHNVPSE